MKSIIILPCLFLSCIFAEFDQNWWKHASNYEIFVMSFKDSNGDGIGDLAGITSKLDYLYELGIRVVKLSSIYSSPDSITPYYGVDNFTQVHSKLGTMDDFEELIAEANKRGIKIILDIVFDHCHSSHEWFQKSIDRVQPFKDYFIWEDPIVTENSSVLMPPNFQVSRNTGAKSWAWIEKRRQFYYSSYNYESPDFNLYNQGLKEELRNVLQFWLNKGVSGFNIKNKSSYFNTYKFTQINSEDLYDFFRELRQYIDIYNEANVGHQRILLTDGNNCDTYTLKCFGNEDSPLAHLVSNFAFIYFDYDDIFLNYGLAEEVKEYSQHIKEGKISEWNTNLLTRTRPKSEGDFRSHITNTLPAVVPGVWNILYGSELGLGGLYRRKKIFIENDFDFGVEKILTMPWDDTKNAGFSDSTHPIYQPNRNYWKINAEKEKNQENSLYHFFKDLLEVRQKETMKYGDVDFFKITEKSTAIVRTLKGHDTYITVINPYNQLEMIDLNQAIQPIPNLAPKLKVVASSPNFLNKKSNQISTTRLIMRPFSSVVLEMRESRN